MKKWVKSSPELVSRFEGLLPDDEVIQQRKMFGYPSAFVRGNFWVGLFQESVIVRLPDGLHEKVAALRGAEKFDPMGGRPMTGWFVVPEAVAKSDGKLQALFEETLEIARGLAPKKKVAKVKAAKVAAPKAKVAAKKVKVAAKKVKVAAKKPAAKKPAPRGPR